MFTAVQVTIGSPDLCANHNITQNFMIVTSNEKFGRLQELLAQEAYDGNRILIFCQTKRNVDDVSRQLVQLLDTGSC